MLLVDPLKRITVPEIRQHPWFTLHLPRYLATPGGLDALFGGGCGRFFARHEAINQRAIRNCPRQGPSGIKRW